MRLTATLMLADGVPAVRVFYQRVGRGKPKRGEYYVSGAIPEIYRAPNDLPSEYLIVKPTHYAKRVESYTKGEAFWTTALRSKAS